MKLMPNVKPFYQYGIHEKLLQAIVLSTATVY